MSRNHGRLHAKRWAAFRREIFERDGWRCTSCGGAGRLECHHPHRLEDGGAPYDPENAKTLCRTCHVEKTASENTQDDPERRAWRALIASL